MFKVLGYISYVTVSKTSIIWVSKHITRSKCISSILTYIAIAKSSLIPMLQLLAPWELGSKLCSNCTIQEWSVNCYIHPTIRVLILFEEPPIYVFCLCRFLYSYQHASQVTVSSWRTRPQHVYNHHHLWIKDILHWNVMSFFHDLQLYTSVIVIQIRSLD